MAQVGFTPELGRAAPDFNLKATDGKTYDFASVAGQNGTVVAFICNHCPYVVTALDRIVRDARDLAGMGVGFVAISANDATSYPADSFDNMKRLAEEKAFPFPYLYDSDQSVARAFDAACTPEFFGFDADGRLRYQGRLDAARTSQPTPDMARDLFDAMEQIARTGQGPLSQNPAIGCSIKWRPSGANGD